MKSDSPTSPFVPFAIGAFALTAIGDVIHALTGDPFWYRFAYISMGIGIVAGIVAIGAGLLDYVRVRMSRRAARIAVVHETLDLVAIWLYAANFLTRRNDAALSTDVWPLVFAAELATFLGWCVSAYLGRVAMEHGIASPGPARATLVRRREGSRDVVTSR